MRPRKNTIRFASTLSKLTTRWFLLFAVFCAVGCGPDRPATFSLVPAPNQAEAAAAVWKIYKRADAVPGIAWVEGAGLDCIDDGGAPGFWQNGGCQRGSYTDGDANVYLARVYDWFEPEALAHEFAHVVQYRTEGASSHSPPWFANDPHTPCYLVHWAADAVAEVTSWR